MLILAAGECRNNLWGYMHTHLGVPEGQQEKIWRPLFQKYNQSLRALKAGGYDIKNEEYWDCLRAGAVEYLRPDPQVCAATCLEPSAYLSVCSYPWWCAAPCASCFAAAPGLRSDGIVVDAYPVQADGECIVYEKK